MFVLILFMDLNSPENIDVIASFVGGKITPKIIRWHNKRYLIKQINLTYEEKIGQNNVYCFAVSDIHDNVFDIAYNPINSHWRIRNHQWS